jgi:CRP/FNR family transcriptional regulator, cyclic AMP receptor protein
MRHQAKGGSERIGHQPGSTSRIPSLLRGLPDHLSLLSGLPEPLFKSLFSRATEVRLRADEVLFFAGDVGDGCYRVEEGLLKVTMVSRSGDERILAFVGPGEIVGELSVIDRRPRSASVIGVQNVALSFLSTTNFQNFARQYPEVYKFLLILLAARIRETDVAIAAATFLSMRGRLACALIELAHHFGEDVGSGRIVIQQKLSQADLAAMAGLARESVSRILNDWTRRKLVSRREGYYRIENKTRLENEEFWRS